eukprot:5577955-Pyramimonas_sp.AAC.1
MKAAHPDLQKPHASSLVQGEPEWPHEGARGRLARRTRDAPWTSSLLQDPPPQQERSSTLQ